jgi:hypothetical protein
MFLTFLFHLNKWAAIIYAGINLFRWTIKEEVEEVAEEVIEEVAMVAVVEEVETKVLLLQKQRSTTSLRSWVRLFLLGHWSGV